MKAAGIGSIGGKPTTASAKKIQSNFMKQFRKKDKNKGSTYDEIALPSEEEVDKKVKGLGAPDKPDDDKQDQSPIERIKGTLDSVSQMMGLGKPEKPKQPVYTPQNVYDTAAFRARASSRNPIDIDAQNRRINAALDFENRTRMYSFPVGGTYDEIKKQKGADERSQKKMAEAINATIEQLYAANDPARQFYQSGVPMEQRLFAPELGYDEIALPSEATIDKKIKGLGARPEVTVTELDYTVKQGDTVSEIAQKFGTTVEEILKANKDIEDKDVIKTGQEITIPNTSPRTQQELEDTDGINSIDFNDELLDELVDLEGRGGDFLSSTPTYDLGITESKANEYNLDPDDYTTFGDFAKDFTKKYVDEKYIDNKDIFKTVDKENHTALMSYLWNAGSFGPRQTTALEDNDMREFVAEMKDAIGSEGFSSSGLSARRAKEANMIGENLDDWNPIVKVVITGTRANPTYTWQDAAGNTVEEYTTTRPLHPQNVPDKPNATDVLNEEIEL
tara:strand:- start:95 stop:1609 length:1515 start_codon:yes stop_codon:yes gene_type:complete